MNFSAFSIHRPLPAILVFILLTAAGLASTAWPFPSVRNLTVTVVK